MDKRKALAILFTLATLYYMAVTGLTIHLWEDGSYYASYRSADITGCLPLAICE